MNYVIINIYGVKLLLLIVSFFVVLLLSCGAGSSCSDFDDCELFFDTMENCEDAAAELDCSCLDFGSQVGGFLDDEGLCTLCDCTFSFE